MLTVKTSPYGKVLMEIRTANEVRGFKDGNVIVLTTFRHGEAAMEVRIVLDFDMVSGPNCVFVENESGHVVQKFTAMPDKDGAPKP
jgi:hypothetical protein